MRIERRTLLLALLAVTAWLGWTHLRDSMEIATVFTRSLSQDHYTRLWIVDDPPNLWVRAERPDRLWLEAMRQNPNVMVWRGGQPEARRAVIWNGGGAHEYVDRLFRAKYGVIDVVAGVLWRRDSVPVRLERRAG